MGSQIIAPTKAPVPVLDGNGTTPVMTMATAMTTVTRRRHTAAVTTRGGRRILVPVGATTTMTIRGNRGVPASVTTTR